MNYCKYIPDPDNIFRRIYIDIITDVSLKVSWILKDRKRLKKPIRFIVEYNQNYNDPFLWEQAAEVIDEYSAEINRPTPTGKINRLGIRVRAIDADSLEYVSFVVPGFGKLSERQWNYISTLIRRYSLVPRNSIFTPGILLKRRWYGPRCRCVSDYTREISDSYCTICYGTGIAGGYWKAWEGRLIDLTPRQMITRRDPHLTRGVTDAQVVAGILPAVIPVDTGDADIHILVFDITREW